MANRKSGLILEIADKFHSYHFHQISANRFNHKTLLNALIEFNSNSKLEIATLGYSEEGREIKNIVYGNGNTNVLLWSQMHGNESTATRAILDILNFLIADDEFNSFRELIAKNLTLQFIPMLNPDGAERFQRRNAMEIDINRDAVALQSQEAKLLHEQVEKFKPHFAFNLHDQRRFYNVTGTGVPSSMSFLAPAYDHTRKVNIVRKKAMQVIAGLNETLQEYIPGGVGLYDDAYSHRSFGDYLQSKGVSTILVESGWQQNDMEKEGVRKLNFISLLKAFELLGTKTFDNVSTESYTSIPTIDTKLFYVLIKSVKVAGSKTSRIDIGINRTEHLIRHPDYYSVGRIDDLGDLSSFFGFLAIDEPGLSVAPGKMAHLNAYEDLSLITVKRLLRQGILFLVTEKVPLEPYTTYPINIVHPRKLPYLKHPVFEGIANFLLLDQANSIKYIILNGFVFQPGEINDNANGLVIS